MEDLKQNRLFYGLATICLFTGFPSSTYFISLVAIGKTDTSHALGVIISFTIFVVGWILYIQNQNVPMVFHTQPSVLRNRSSRSFRKKSFKSSTKFTSLPKSSSKRKAEVDFARIVMAAFDDVRNERISNNIPRPTSLKDVPRESSGDAPRERSSGDIPPEISSGDIPPEISSGDIPPEISSGGVPSERISNDVLLERSSCDVPRESSNDVPRGRSSNDVPRESSGDVPRESSGDVARESSGNVARESSVTAPRERRSNDVPREGSSKDFPRERRSKSVPRESSKDIFRKRCSGGSQTKRSVVDASSPLQESDTVKTIPLAKNKSHVKEESTLGLDGIKKRTHLTKPLVFCNDHRNKRMWEMNYLVEKIWSASRRTTDHTDYNMWLLIRRPQPYEIVSYYLNQPSLD